MGSQAKQCLWRFFLSLHLLLFFFLISNPTSTLFSLLSSFFSFLFFSFRFSQTPIGSMQLHSINQALSGQLEYSCSVSLFSLFLISLSSPSIFLSFLSLSFLSPSSPSSLFLFFLFRLFLFSFSDEIQKSDCERTSTSEFGSKLLCWTFV